uniref:Uncharacterized protein n=1 Tax=Molossus molossus TaxID=27622 RepID=A0A7J8CS19_MOLMO|nr:hypothetical protein HJG59_009756 [Molossus molossus]
MDPGTVGTALPSARTLGTCELFPRGPFGLRASPVSFRRKGSPRSCCGRSFCSVPFKFNTSITLSRFIRYMKPL